MQKGRQDVSGWSIVSFFVVCYFLGILFESKCMIYNHLQLLFIWLDSILCISLVLFHNVIS